MVIRSKKTNRYGDVKTIETTPFVEHETLRLKRVKFDSRLFTKQEVARKSFRKKRFSGGKIQYMVTADTPNGRFTATSNAYSAEERPDRESMILQANENLMKQLAGDFTDEYSVSRGLAVYRNLKKKNRIRIREGFRTIKRSHRDD